MDITRGIETPEETYGKDKRALVQRWITEINLYDEEFKDYGNHCSAILARYRNEKKRDENNDRPPSFNVLWSNNNILEPAVYAQRAKLVAKRRFNDKDPVARDACEMIERFVHIAMDDDRYDYDNVVMRARQDYILLGRGVLWERYEPVITDDDQVTWEYAICEHLHYDDFGHTPGARSWEEVSCVWRKAYMTRKELVKRFGKVGHEVPLDYVPDRLKSRRDEDARKYEHFKKAVVYEIWDKTERKVIWICKQYVDAPLDVKDDPLELRGFFPCPKPAYGTLTNDSLVPVPDYVQIEDLCAEMDWLTARISNMLQAIKCRVAYEQSLGTQGLGQLLKGDDNRAIAVDMSRWLGQSGGNLDNLIWMMPIDKQVATLQVLYDARERTKQIIYEISGNSDILRGATDARETATAQRIKGQFASYRLESKRTAFNRFVKDGLLIKAEIICERFKPETLAQMVGANPMDPQFQEPLQLLRNDTLRSYRVDIETDSTILLDEQTEKQDVTELVANLGQYFQNAIPMAMQVPELTPIVGEVLMLALRRFKAGRSIEDTMEQALEALTEKAQMAGQQQPPPDPQMVKVQQDAQAKQMEAQAKIAVEQERLRLKEQEMQQHGALKQQELQLKAESTYAELEQKQARQEAELAIAQQKALASIMGDGEDRRLRAEVERSRAMQQASKQQ